MKDVLIVIPARYGSTRFPGKPLVSIAGMSLIERVHRNCARMGRGVRVVVATDNHWIRAHVEDFGGCVRMTRPDHPSGTDRVAEVARHFPCKIVINVQGDEPLLDPSVIRKLAQAMKKDASVEMGTLCHPITRAKDYEDPHVVKVVTDLQGNALYFSRSSIPHFRDCKNPKSEIRNPKSASAFRHIGIYAYRRNFLLQFVRWPQSCLEKAEKLEQLRALERGAKIRVLKTDYEAIGVDVPEDVRKVERMLKSSKFKV